MKRLYMYPLVNTVGDKVLKTFNFEVTISKCRFSFLRLNNLKKQRILQSIKFELKF